MIIYRVGADYENYKFFVFERDEEAPSELGSHSLAMNWKPPRLMIYVQSPKRRDKRSEDFDVSFYFSDFLFVNTRAKEIFQQLLTDEIECLSVITIMHPDEFVLINILVEVDAIDFEGMDNEAISSAISNNTLIFKKNQIEGRLFFKASATGSCYCTNSFIELIEHNNIKGFRFDPVGEAK